MRDDRRTQQIITTINDLTGNVLNLLDVLGLQELHRPEPCFMGMIVAFYAVARTQEVFLFPSLGGLAALFYGHQSAHRC